MSRDLVEIIRRHHGPNTLDPTARRMSASSAPRRTPAIATA
jgi:hypothetical protein